MATYTKCLLIATAILIPFLGGWIVNIILPRDSPRNDTWYNSLIQPPLNPPGWLFAPVWTFIYITMGIASYLVYAELVDAGKGFDRTAQIALASYVIQLIFNKAWTPIFFKYHSLKWVSNLNLHDS